MLSRGSRPRAVRVPRRRAQVASADVLAIRAFIPASRPALTRAALLGGVWLGALAALSPKPAHAVDATWTAPTPGPGEVRLDVEVRAIDARDLHGRRQNALAVAQGDRVPNLQLLGELLVDVEGDRRERMLGIAEKMPKANKSGAKRGAVIKPLAVKAETGKVVPQRAAAARRPVRLRK